MKTQGGLNAGRFGNWVNVTHASAVITSFPGFFVGEPTVTDVGGRDELVWTFPLPKRVLPNRSIVLEFDTTAQVDPGDYWNEAWVTFTQFPDPVYTYPTARIKSMAVSGVKPQLMGLHDLARHLVHPCRRQGPLGAPPESRAQAVHDHYVF